jgi:hypothetical protein
MGTHFAMSGMGVSDIAYFAFCIISKVMELSIYEQSIHYQIDKVKNRGYWKIWCSRFIFTVRTPQVRIFTRYVPFYRDIP